MSSRMTDDLCPCSRVPPPHPPSVPAARGSTPLPQDEPLPLPGGQVAQGTHPERAPGSKAQLGYWNFEAQHHFQHQTEIDPVSRSFRRRSFPGTGLLRLPPLHAGRVRRRRVGMRLQVAADHHLVVQATGWDEEICCCSMYYYVLLYHQQLFSKGYTATAIPTHAQIQKCLVDIGDKEASFQGSKQWIGSTEVGFVLEKACEVTSRFLSVSSGDEMPTKGRELAHHFKTHGTPVMIGQSVAQIRST